MQMGTNSSRSMTAKRATMAMLLGSAALAAPLPAAGQTTSTTGSSQAIILRPLSFFNIDDLDFGAIIPNGTSAGTLRMQPNGTRTATGGMVLVDNSQQPARFTGLGAPNQVVQIRIQGNSSTLTGPGAAILAQDFEISNNFGLATTPSPVRFRITSASGAFDFAVGATLNIGANQAAGDYSGSFTVNVNYQ